MIHPTHKSTCRMHSIKAIHALAFLFPAPILSAIMERTNPKMIRKRHRGSRIERQTMDATSWNVKGM